MTSDDDYVREEQKGGSYMKAATVLALLGGMAAAYGYTGNHTATELQKEAPLINTNIQNQAVLNMQAGVKTNEI